MTAAAVFDVCRRRIPNSVNVAIAVTGAAASYWAGGPTRLASGLGAALLVGAFMLVAWRLHAIGGGDLKLAVACSTWVGVERLFPFLMAAAVAGGAVALLCLVASSGRVKREVAVNLKLVTSGVIPAVSIAQGGGRVSVPYGAAVVVAAVWMLARG